MTWRALIARPVTVRRSLIAAVIAGLAAVLVGPVAAGPIAPAVSAHSQLVSSSPGAGDVVPTSPTEIRLVFSEPIEPRYTSLDVLDGEGKAIVLDVGSADPADDHILVAPVPALSAGSYTVNWRAVSAADGHVTQGFITFGVGAGSSGGEGSSNPSNSGDLHAGHSGGQVIADLEGKTANYGGLLLAFGLGLLALLFRRQIPGVLGMAANAVWILLLVAASGSLVGLIVGAASLPTSVASGNIDLVDYATQSRVGQLLLAQTIVALSGAAVVFGLTRARHLVAALLVGIATAAVGFGLVALGGHAAGFDSPVPLFVDLVHLAAGGVWLSGVVGLVWLALVKPVEPGVLGSIVPRFSAVALVAVALIVATGTYQAWIQTYDFTSVANPYSLNLALKVAVFLIALVFGALNYFDGGRDRGWLGGFRTRVFLEAGLAIAVVVLTANLTSGSPTGESQPIAIAPAVSSAPAGAVSSSFAIQPGRPGPNRYLASVSPAAPAGSTVVLVLQRLDTDVGTSRLPLRPATAAESNGATSEFLTDGGQLAADSSWDATVIVSTAAGQEIGRTRFTFALDQTGISAGRQLPPLDPVLLVAVLLLLGGLLGLAYGVAGGRLPRCDVRTSRIAVISGSMVGTVLGLIILSGGPR